MKNVLRQKDARRGKSVLIVEALSELLKDVCANPTAHQEDQALVTALKSQGALAKYENSGRSITPMSLNHQKVIAELAFGSYQNLDSLRRSAIDALETQRRRQRARNSNNKAGLVERIKQLEAEQSILLEDLMILQWALDCRCRQARQYASKADKATKALCATEQREIDVSLSLRRRPVSQTNVIPLGRKRHERT